MRKDVVIFGATGFLGRRIAASCLERGMAVHAAVRQAADSGDLSRAGCVIVPGDLCAPESLAELVRILEAVPGPVSIVATFGSVDYRARYREAVPANITPIAPLTGLCEQLAAHQRLDRLVFVGSVAARGFLDRRPARGMTETDDFWQRGRAVYCDIKRDAEADLKGRCAKAGIAPVIVEPGSLVGPRIAGKVTTTLSLMERAIGGKPVLSGGASYVNVARVADGIAGALERGEPGSTYLLGGENLSMEDFALLVRERAKALGIPLSARRPAVIPRRLAVMLGSLSLGMNRQNALLGSSWHFIDSAKARSSLGYTHGRTDLEAAIDAALSGGSA